MTSPFTNSTCLLFIHLQSHLSSLFWNPWENLQSFPLCNWQFNTLLGSTFLAISIFAKHFLLFVILRMLWWQYGRWHHLSQTQLDSWNLCNCSTEWCKIPRWYSNLFFGLYHLENDGCMGFDGVGVISLESDRCCSTNLSGRGMSILTKTFEQLMLLWDLVRPHK